MEPSSQQQERLKSGNGISNGFSTDSAECDVSPQRDGGVITAVRTLEITVETLRDAAAYLDTRLALVTRSGVPEKNATTKQAMDHKCELERSILNQDAVIGEVVELLQDLSRRLEV